MAHHLFDCMINALENKLVSVENDIGNHPQYFNAWSPKSPTKIHVFRRQTKLTLRIMFWLIVSRIVRSLPVALDSFFSSLNLQAPTKSAFSMKRQTIKSDFFRDMLKTLVEEFYKSDAVKKWRGYVLMACDGSRLALPNVNELGEHYGWYHTTQGENLYPTAKACVFYDTLNNITVYAKVEDKDEDEKYSFENYFRDAVSLTGSRTIMLLDRGYFSYNVIYLMIKNNVKFVMKAKKLPWTSEFVSSGRKQQTMTVKPGRYTSICSNPEWALEPEKELTVRLVRFEHPDKSVDVLVTNLTSDEMVSASDVIALYRMRWPVETGYGIYKNDEALELFSTFRVDGIVQDFYGAAILFNLASILSRDCLKKGKGSVKPDMNVVIGLIHNLCPLMTLGPGSHLFKSRLRIIVIEAAHYDIQIQPGRSFPRIRHLRKTSGKFYRHINFALAV